MTDPIMPTLCRGELNAVRGLSKVRGISCLRSNFLPCPCHRLYFCFIFSPFFVPDSLTYLCTFPLSEKEYRNQSIIFHIYSVRA